MTDMNIMMAGILAIILFFSMIVSAILITGACLLGILIGSVIKGIKYLVNSI